jgi:glycosyltransferase involved in cell wall biosynthesis
VAIFVDTFPKLSETFVASEVRALARLGIAVRVEATQPGPGPSANVATGYLLAAPRARRACALLWLLTRHPRRVAGDLLGSVRWRRAEQVHGLPALAVVARRVREAGTVHLHAHFAATAALDALRVARLLDLPYSVTAHAYDIYLHPRNLAEKLRGAAFATSGCAYTVNELRARVGPPHAGRVHEQVMGVDPARFRRRTAHADHGHVVAVGRLVAKKGFAHLIEAAALMTGEPLRAVTIAGDGPLRAELADLVARRGLADVVTLAGPRTPEAVRALLERADVLAAPCVVASDGDRDSMPVVVKEALAMEVPVVASDAVGLPEVVHPAWGELVAPGDPLALAAALERMLGRPAGERAAMGRAGRAWVLEHADVHRETARLVELIAAAGGR